jgi:hypothetical protein
MISFYELINKVYDTIDTFSINFENICIISGLYYVISHNFYRVIINKIEENKKEHKKDIKYIEDKLQFKDDYQDITQTTLNSIFVLHSEISKKLDIKCDIMIKKFESILRKKENDIEVHQKELQEIIKEINNKQEEFDFLINKINENTIDKVSHKELDAILFLL